MRALLTALVLSATCWASAQNIIAYEYWFNQNDITRTQVSIAASSTVNVVDNISIGTLPLGHHTINYRLKDSNGRWSGVLTKPFTRLVGGPYELVSGEYWFDQNYANNTPFTLGPGQVISTTIDPDASGLAQGQHKVHYRLRDNHANWSSVISKSFSVLPGEPYELVLLRYWSDQAEQDPSDLTEVPITPAVQYLDIIDNVLFCNWSSTGQTDVFFQLKDNHAQWSSIIKKSANIDGATAPPTTPDAINGLNEPPYGSTQTYSVPNDPNAGGYVWILPPTWTGSSTTNSITVVVGIPNESWYLGVMAVNGCGVSDTTFLQIITEQQEEAVLQQFQLFPNPTNGIVQLRTPNASAIDRLQLFNSMGQAVLDMRPTQQEIYTMDLSEIATGLYTLRIMQGDKATMRQVLVQH